MKMILIYSTKPDVKPLAFVKDVSDVAATITQRVERAKEAARGRGTEESASIIRWLNASCVEVELSEIQ